VQYGLRAFNEGKIGAEKFLELNELIGGFDADGNLGPARSSGDPRALRIAYETGRIDTGGGGLGSVPIIDFRRYGDLEGNPHDRMRSAQIRLRIERAHGSAANQVLLVNPTDAQFTRLKKIFPQGVCDYSRPGVGENTLRQTWISYGDK